MNIIGKTGDGWSGKFIVIAEQKELAQIMGFAYDSEKFCPKIEIGSEIKVSKIFDYLREVAQADGNIKLAAKTLRTVADLAEIIIPMFPLPSGKD